MFRAASDNFAALRNRNIRIYLSGQAVSLVGTWLQTTAQGWVVWKLTGSTIDLGITTMLSTLPLLLLTPWTGALADRYDRRKLLIATQLGAMCLAFILAALVLTDTVQIGHVYLMSALLGLITALDMPAQQAFVGDLAGTGDPRKAVNLNSMLSPVSRLVGPALAGIVIALFGVGVAFLLNGFSFLAVVISLLRVQVQAQTAPPSIAAPPKGSGLGGFGEALAFVRSQPTLVNLILFVMLLTFFGTPILVNMLPAVATNVLGGDAEILGALMSAAGAGALLGTMLLTPWAQTFRRTGLVLSVATLIAGFSYLMFGASTFLPLSLGMLFVAGAINPSVTATVTGLLQLQAPLDMRARVMGLLTMVSFGLQPIAALWLGVSADHFGIQQAILINAALLVCGGLVLLVRTTTTHPLITPLPAVAPTPSAGD